MMRNETAMANNMDNNMRTTPLWFWLTAGFGGIFPDIDHIPEVIAEKTISLPIIGKLNQLMGFTYNGYGRPLHALFTISAIILTWYSISRLCRHLRLRILGGEAG